MERKYNDVECFMYYMYNKWSKDEAIRLFGDNLGNHIFGKWVAKRETYDQTMSWYGDLDKVRRDALLKRAIECYGNVEK